jgi:uncharacterized membrane protein
VNPEINITAAKSFNRGLRAVYFALASCGWLLGPVGLLARALVTAIVLWRREFASRSRVVLIGAEDGMPGINGTDQPGTDTQR